LKRNEIANIGRGAVDVHDQLMHMASKLVAHSVNPWETVKVGVRIEDGRVTGVGAKMFRVAGFVPGGMANWKWIIDDAIEMVRARALAAGKELMREISKLPPEQLQKLKPLEMELPNLSEVGKSRDGE
jgi:hypothetical protein